MQSTGMKVFAYATMALLVLIFYYKRTGTRICRLYVDHKAHIAVVEAGLFHETIPQTGLITLVENKELINIPIDQLYLKRVKPGLKAVTIHNGHDYFMEIVRVDTTLCEGRFTALANFTDTIPRIDPRNTLRLRIYLAAPREALLIPLGGFYKDTGGTWIFVLDDHGILKRRQVRLGARNTDYFEVLEGLEAGERVLTSPYDNFVDKKSISIEEIDQKLPLRLM